MADDRLHDVYAEMTHRAQDGCTGSHDGTCNDPEMAIHPEQWCNRCLMGAAVQAALDAEAADAALTALQAQHEALTQELNGWREVGEEMGRIVSFMSPEQKDDLLPDWFGPRLFDMQVKAASSSCEASEKGT